MKAFRLNEFGGPQGSAIEDIGRPSARPGEVVVRIVTAGVNQMDWKVQQGWIQEYIPYRLPLTLGWDLAGTIEQIGDGVSGWAIGDAVFAAAALIDGGAYAEAVALRADLIAAKPDGLSFAQAAAVPIAGITAYNALFEGGRLSSGQSLLIHGAAGAVGHYALQIAKHADAHVTTTCSTRGIGLVRSLGADVAIDYTREDFTAAGPFDLVLDCVGGAVRDRSWPLLKPGGTLVTLVPPYDPAKDRLRADVTATMTGVTPDGAKLAKIAAMIAQGAIRPVIAAEFALDDIADALAMSRTNHSHGKIIVRVADEP